MWDEDDEGAYERPVRRFRPIDALVMAIGLPREILGAAVDWLQDLIELVAAHGNWKLEQESAPVKVTR